MAYEVINEHPDVEQMKIAWEEADIQRGGTVSMRRHYQRYLEQQKGELDDAFMKRGARSVYWPFVIPAINSWSGRVTQEEVVLDGPDELAFFEDDLDGKGNNITKMFGTFIWNQYYYGGNRRIVDSPKMISGDMMSAIANREFPYLLLVEPPEFYNYRWDSRERFTQVRIRMMSEVPDPTNEFKVNKQNVWRVFDPDRYRDYGRANGTTGQIVMLDERRWWGLTDYVPAATSYGERVSAHRFQSEIGDVFYMNADHFDLTSRIKIGGKFALDRILHLSGITFQEHQTMLKELTDGTQDSILYSGKTDREENPPEAEFVQSTVDGLMANKELRAELEAAIVSRTVQVLLPRTGDQTATEASLDAADEMSSLAANAQKGETFFEEAIKDMLRMFRPGISKAALDAVHVEANKNFGLSLQVQRELDELEKARKRGDIKALPYLRILQDRGVLPADMDLQEAVGEMPADNQQQGEMPTGETPEP